MNNFWVDLTDISAKKEALPSPSHVPSEPVIVFRRYEKPVLLFSKLSKLFLDTSIENTFLKMMKMNKFWGD